MTQAWAANNLQQINLALIHYREVFRRWPPASSKSPDGKPLLSWRVLILPFVEESALYKEFKLDEPWDSPHNLPLLAKLPGVYRDPRAECPKDETPYQVFVGPGTAFEHDNMRWPLDFTDPHGDTVLVVEAKGTVPWTKPVDLAYDPQKPLPELGGRYGRAKHFLRRVVGYQPGFNAGFADGSLRFIPTPAPEPLLRGIITRNGGESLDWPEGTHRYPPVGGEQ